MSNDLDFDPMKILREAADKAIAKDWAKRKSVAELRAKYKWSSDEHAHKRMTEAIRRDAKSGKSN